MFAFHMGYHVIPGTVRLCLTTILDNAIKYGAFFHNGFNSNPLSGRLHIGITFHDRLPKYGSYCHNVKNQRVDG